MSAFPVGTVCIIQNCVVDTQYNGMECTITGPLMMRRSITSSGLMEDALAYGTDAPSFDGWRGTSVFAPENLRRKQPPQTFTGETRIISLFTPTKQLETA